MNELRTMAVMNDVCYGLGVGVAVFFAFKILQLAKRLRYLYFADPVIVYSEYGPWAVVTGCTSGIGREFALQLADKGLNIVLVSRNLEKLGTLSLELKDRFSKIQTKIVLLDFTKNNDSQYEDLQTAIRDIDIGLLINNAGVDTRTGLFLSPDVSFASNIDVVSCNNVGSTRIIEIVMPSMLTANKGLIVNISSFAASKLFGFFAVYAASKKLMSNFSKGLLKEYEDKNIKIQVIEPLYVITNLTKDAVGVPSEPTLFVPNSATYVKSCLRAIGKHPVIHGYLFHDVEAAILKLIPTNVLYFLIKSRKSNIKL